ncbi:TPA: hypothetical protein DDW35_09050 [Candidatus Sumerlaeota bacterium]|jgi:uncharacterized protein with HEPN domain|nr:hypothetical protein [Candidatus Sumerlaeota bacterium]
MSQECCHSPQLYEMLMHTEAILDTTSGVKFDEYLTNKTLRLATERRMEHLSNAAQNLPPDFQSAYPQIPWNKLEAQSSVLRHVDFQGKQEVLYRIATHHLHELHEALLAVRRN